jgi:acyl-CoA synthetase (NDP forming)
VAALEDVLLEVSALADDCPAVAELDCNPVIVHDRGVVVVDARIRVAERAPERPLGAR